MCVTIDCCCYALHRGRTVTCDYYRLHVTVDCYRHVLLRGRTVTCDYYRFMLMSIVNVTWSSAAELLLAIIIDLCYCRLLSSRAPLRPNCYLRLLSIYVTVDCYRQVRLRGELLLAIIIDYCPLLSIIITTLYTLTFTFNPSSSFVQTKRSFHSSDCCRLFNSMFDCFVCNPIYMSQLSAAASCLLFIVLA